MKTIPVQFEVICYETGRNIFQSVDIDFPENIVNDHEKMDQHIMDMNKHELMYLHNWRQINDWKFNSEHEDLVKYLASMANGDEEFISTLAICYQTMKDSIKHLPFLEQAYIIVNAVEFGLKGVSETVRQIREILKPSLKTLEKYEHIPKKSGEIR